MNVLPLIEAKRDGQDLTPAQIKEIVSAYTADEIPDYQMAALLMAIYFRGLDVQETRALTLAMRDSGKTLSFPDDPRPVVDKHSTGGVGDKVSLPLAPLLACLGFRVPMISGRGLGITGGTLDKLESIPGFSTQIEPDRIVAQVQEIGCVICGQTAEMAPADKTLYLLRDVTATVPSIPLITASILSKKLAEGLQALVLDVKFGAAAFMQDIDQARHLAGEMVRLGRECGVEMRALLTDMNAPLGASAGNWLEVKESVACLENRGPEDLRELVLKCAAHLMEATGKASDVDEGTKLARICLESGEPRQRWEAMLEAQGADLAKYRELLTRKSLAPVTAELHSRADGYLAGWDARRVGELVRDMGGGRLQKDTVLDLTVGVDDMVPAGKVVRQGDTLATVHARNDSEAQISLQRMELAVKVTKELKTRASLVYETLS